MYKYHIVYKHIFNIYRHEECTHGSVAAPVSDTVSVDNDCSEQDYLYNYHTAKLNEEQK